MLKSRSPLPVVKHCQRIPERVAFGHFQTPHCQASTTPAPRQRQASNPREPKPG